MLKLIMRKNLDKVTFLGNTYLCAKLATLNFKLHKTYEVEVWT